MYNVTLRYILRIALAALRLPFRNSRDSNMPYSSTGAQTRACEPSRFSSLPRELKVTIMEHMPDMYSLYSLLLADRGYYATFRLHEQYISTAVLRNLIPPTLYTHALVTQQALKGNFLIPNLDSINIEDIAGYVVKIPEARDTATTRRVSIQDAGNIHNTFIQVCKLTDLFLQTCATTKGQVFSPLQSSLEERKPTGCETQRTAQAIYLFQIIASMTEHLTLDRAGDNGYRRDYYDKITKLQIELTRKALAPWEMYQVIAVKDFFTRALYGLRKFSRLSDLIVY